MKKLLPGIVFAFFLQVVPGFSRGDKVVPQVADGGGYRTKFDLINVSPDQGIYGTFILAFFKPDGTPWELRTSLSSTAAAQFPITLAPRQKVRVETLGTSSQTISGYAVLQDKETSSSLKAMDYAIGISVFYEVTRGTSINETVSVPVPAPTALGSFPVEITQSTQVYTGIAIVNLSDDANTVKLDLYPSGAGTNASTIVTLRAHEQIAQFFHQIPAFSALAKGDFKGIAEFKSLKPMAVLALLQTQAQDGVQYATLVPVDREALRQSTYLAIPQAYVKDSRNESSIPVDVDRFIIDENSNEEELNWDFLYLTNGKTTRRFEPYTPNGAQFAVLGKMTLDQYRALSLSDLKNLPYSNNGIDLKDGSPALESNYAFAVKTDLGYYAKLRVLGNSGFDDFDEYGVPIKYVDMIVYAVIYR